MEREVNSSNGSKIPRVDKKRGTGALISCDNLREGIGTNTATL